MCVYKDEMIHIIKCMKLLDERTDVTSRTAWQSDQSDKKKTRTLNMCYNWEDVSTTVPSLAMPSGNLTATFDVNNSINQLVFRCLQNVQRENRVTATLKMLKSTKGYPHPSPSQEEEKEEKKWERERKKMWWRGRNDGGLIFAWNSSPVMKAKECLRYHVCTLIGRYITH